MTLSDNYLVIDLSVSQLLSIICFFRHLQIDTLLACGGLAKNPLFLQQHADIIGISSCLPQSPASLCLWPSVVFIYLEHTCTHR